MSYIECVKKFVSIKEKLVEADKRLIQLVVHPDLNDEQLREVRAIRLNVERMMEDAVTALRKKYPPEKNLYSRIGSGWNDRCYDRYDRELRPKRDV